MTNILTPRLHQDSFSSSFVREKNDTTNKNGLRLLLRNIWQKSWCPWCPNLHHESEYILYIDIIILQYLFKILSIYKKGHQGHQEFSS